MKQLDITFMSGHSPISGILHLPEGEKAPLVVGSHGLEGSKASAKQAVLAEALPAMGIAFFRFDHRGCGSSGGSFLKDTSLAERTRDLIHAVDYLRNLQKTRQELMLFGSSLGGATCINAWQHLEEMGAPPAGAVICSAPVDSTTISNIPTAATDQRPALPLDFFKKNLVFDLRLCLGRLHHVLIFHGDQDSVVPPENAQLLHDGAAPPKKLILQAGGDHPMTEPHHQAEFIRETGLWMRSVFGLSESLDNRFAYHLKNAPGG